MVVYLCAGHVEALSNPKMPMTDDVLICQVPTCFKVASWKCFLECEENSTPEEALEKKRTNED